MKILRNLRVHLIDELNGPFIPRKFVEMTSGWQVDQDDANVLRLGPDTEGYWEAWDSVLEAARFTDKEGVEWGLDMYEGSLFCIPTNIFRCRGCETFLQPIDGINVLDCPVCHGDCTVEDVEIDEY